jgi:tetratricopeptide (TPR) repeat protein
VLQEAIDRHYGATQAWYGLGIAHLQANRAAEALMAFERSVELQVDFDLAWYGKGLALLQASRVEEALEALIAATTANPRCTLAWMRQAETLEQLGRRDAARVAYEQVIQHTPPTEALHVQAQRQLQRLRP